jgi:glutamine synthetase
MARRPAGSSNGVGKVMEMLTEHSVEYVDLRFTDPRGKWQHTAQHVSTIEEETFRDGIMFDGSSIAGWKAINESDMILMPDADAVMMDPFSAKPSLIVFCDIVEPSTGQPYNRDPRSTAKKAEAYLKSSGVGDSAFFGPEAEFFIFDSVKYGTGGNYGIYQIDSQEGPQAGLKDYPEGNMGHRPAVKGGYFPVPPVDSESDLRAEMLSTMAEMGVVVEKHHHEVGQSQHELGIKFGPLVKLADSLQIYKYCIHNVAHSYGKTACFMPKPIYGDNGSGMHVHQSIWKAGKPLFAGNAYADLSRQGAERTDQPADQQLQAADPRLRGSGAAGLFGPQPLGVLPHSVRHEPEGQARRSTLPGPGRKPLPGVRRHAHGGSGRYP